MYKFKYALKVGILAVLLYYTMNYIVPIQNEFSYQLIYSIIFAILLMILVYIMLGSIKKDTDK
ncbi:hypothetical protein MUA68_00170 [Staphylococcus aureus]|nr:hypothetical protein MUA68_00170 [Staphylococcus aureus]